MRGLELVRNHAGKKNGKATSMLTSLSRLLHRAWQTLWKPVPELINILGVEVPDAPEVSLAGIRANAVTVHWTRPSANRPVNKYLIQVNGVDGRGVLYYRCLPG